MKFRIWLITALVIFITGLVIGLITPDVLPDAITSEARTLEKLAELIAGLPPLAAVLLVFLKNSLALFFSFIFSPLLCIVPLISLVANGWLLGVVSHSVLQQKSVLFLLAGILPHGILELPAFFMGQAVALAFGISVMAALVKRTSAPISTTLKAYFKYFLISLALLLPAAFIEIFVTGRLLTK
jgi:stage II sporulation protein M